MLFLLFGSSGSGKTVALDALRRRNFDAALHDFDEIGVPPDADTAWRQNANEDWIQRVLAIERDREDVVLTGATPMGELLAAPSAPALEAVSFCLVDCADAVRLERLRQRPGPEWRGDLGPFLQWAAWMRGHVADPEHRPEVIREGGAPGQRWERWSGWRRGDPRWRAHVADTTAAAPEQVAHDVALWAGEERALLATGRHPLERGWSG